jgi:UDP-N-acetylglucosamine 4,6-dehydratase
MSILVTGGTGSFGRAFVRRLLELDTENRICIYSRGEHAQASMRAEFGNDGRLRFFIGDIRDRDRLRRAMDGCDVVVHAAALKRIEVCEYDPIEVKKTNVDGAVNVIEAATDAGVWKVVALSTDKACDPINAYGASKLLAERLFLAANNARGRAGPIFAVCRYGNVTGSAGSVIPKWREILKTSDTVPVTDPDCTRFHMRIDQAVDLVLRTIGTMQGGELNVPELPAYRLGDLAEAMGAEIRVTGLPAWEKRHESMLPGYSSDMARRMSVDEIRQELAHL